jgi:hypothetical protein
MPHIAWGLVGIWSFWRLGDELRSLAPMLQKPQLSRAPKPRVLQVTVPYLHSERAFETAKRLV